MKSIELDCDIERNQQQQRDQDALTKSVLIESEFNSARDSSFFEFSNAQASNRSGLPRVASWRVARTERHCMVNSDTPDLSWVYMSRVIATRSWSSESMDIVSTSTVKRRFDLVADSNRHGVANIDCDYILPTALNRVERIDDSYALVIDLDLWPYEDQITRDHYQSAPDQSCDSAFEREVTEALVGIDGCSDCCERKENQAASRSEDNRVTHPLIISRGALL